MNQNSFRASDRGGRRMEKTRFDIEKGGFLLPSKFRTYPSLVDWLYFKTLQIKVSKCKISKTLH